MAPLPETIIDHGIQAPRVHLHEPMISTTTWFQRLVAKQKKRTRTVSTSIRSLFHRANSCPDSVGVFVPNVNNPHFQRFAARSKNLERRYSVADDFAKQQDDIAKQQDAYKRSTSLDERPLRKKCSMDVARCENCDKCYRLHLGYSIDYCTLDCKSAMSLRFN